MIKLALKRKSTTASSTVAIGTATAFIFSAAVLGLAADRHGPGAIGAGWTLRGQVSDLANAPKMKRRV